MDEAHMMARRGTLLARLNRSRIAKRVFDVTCAGLALAVVGVPLALTAATVRCTLGSPVLFRQTRPGLQGRPFTLYKFRTMLDLRDAEGRLLPDEARMTRIGRMLRKLSLDEVPELFNVLKGDMSIVGPRPLLMEYLERYTPEQARRHEVKPGLTGWAVVNGRNALSWEEKFRLDVWYVDNWNLLLDMRIMWRTIVMVLKREGVNAEGHVTMPRFEGTVRK